MIHFFNYFKKGELYMSTNHTLVQNQIMQFILGKWISKPIYVAAKLMIADILKDSAMEISELAQKTTTDSASLYRLMRALACVQIFEEKENHTFANTPMSSCLCRDRLRPAAMLFHSKWHDRMWDNLLHSVTTGESAFENIHGQPVFEWFDTHEKEAGIFHKANAFKAASTHKAIIEVFDFSRFRTLMDVGGGLGTLMMEILMANPSLKGTVAEQPEILPLIEEQISRNNQKNRCQAVACDFFKAIPKGSDAYLLSHILHDWPDEQCSRILNNIKKAMGDSAKLLVAEYIIPGPNEFSISKLMDLEVLLMGNGKERTEKEFASLFHTCGLHLEQILPTEEGIFLMEVSNAR